MDSNTHLPLPGLIPALGRLDAVFGGRRSDGGADEDTLPATYLRFIDAAAAYPGVLIMVSKAPRPTVKRIITRLVLFGRPFGRQHLVTRLQRHGNGSGPTV